MNMDRAESCARTPISDQWKSINANGLIPSLMRGGEKLCSTSVLRLRLPTYRRRFSLCIFSHRPQSLSTHLSTFFLSFVSLQASVNLFYSFCVGKRVSLCGEKIKNVMRWRNVLLAALLWNCSFSYSKHCLRSRDMASWFVTLQVCSENTCLCCVGKEGSIVNHS